MKRYIVLLVCLLVFLETVFIFRVSADEILEDEPFIAVFSANSTEDASIPKIGAGSAIVMDTKSGRVLFEKNAYSRRPMASTTKIMTAIVALENGNLDDIIVVSKRAAAIGGSTINLKTGQEIRLRELLYGLMLNSGNDAAIAIAEHIGGTVENFVRMMNEKAIEIGVMDTSFKSPHGLDVDGHYSTAYDLAVITGYALKNPVFAEIVKTKHANIGYTNLSNTNEMLSIYPGADGVKTGYTGKAGRCLVTSATRDGWQIISVVLGCPTRYIRAQSSMAILDYAFENFKPHVLIEKGEKIKTLKVIKGVESYVDVLTIDEIVFPLKEDEKDKVQMYLELPEKLDAPIYANVEVGNIYCYLDGELIGYTGLKTDASIRRKVFRDYLGMIFEKWIRLIHEGIF
ncbi:MAG TPA: D-alanyl-D-alanine carboxypeptidase [Clostridiaceae bacterium]|nr:D-alanyl-D-alanine carboxypeptidase [Clostridiaceae bacterium]